MDGRSDVVIGLFQLGIVPESRSLHSTVYKSQLQAWMKLKGWLYKGGFCATTKHFGSAIRVSEFWRYPIELEQAENVPLGFSIELFPCLPVM